MRLQAPAGEDTRPTLDRVKEAVFSMLAVRLPNADVLDLFAGSGALGLESLSRGAASAVFVDNSAAAIACIKANISSARMQNRAAVKNASASDYIKSCGKGFDIIFLDPPYGGGLYGAVLAAISESGVLNDDGIIICEWDFGVGKPDIPQDFVSVKEKKYGRVCISVLAHTQQ